MIPAPDDVARLRDHLSSGRPVPLVDHPIVDTIDAELSRLHRKASELEHRRVTIGILGGTGVGKSTLLNALAGIEISRTGDRRPTTDLVVCYRHGDDPVPDTLDPRDLSDPPPPHDSEMLRGIVILDLPDIDSLRSQHRERVHRVLPHLDLLLVVTSVDKYGDRLLYEEIRAFPHAPKNISYVLNAVDRVTGDERSAIEVDYRQKLQRFGEVPEPMILSTSALEATHGNGTHGGVESVKEVLAGLSGDRARHEALVANLKTRLRRVASQWHAHLPPAEIDAWWPDLAELARELPPPPGPAEESLRRKLEEIVTPWLRDRAQRASWFPIGPAYFICRKLRILGAHRPVNDPFRSETDPLDDFSETFLHRPLRLRVHESQRILERHAGRLTVDLPAPEASPHSRAPLALWTDRLRRFAPRLAWKLKAHVIPATAVVLFLARVVASLTPGEDQGWFSTALSAMWAALVALSPTMWGLVLAAVILYYLAVYPYFLYRLERRIHRECEVGAQLYLTEWQKEFHECWCRPFGERLERAQAWWEQAESRWNRVWPGDD